jgi:hypothetical protein
MKKIFILLILYSCGSAELSRERDKKISEINSTIFEKSKQNGSFIAQDASASYSWIEWIGERQRMILYDSAFQIFKIWDWYRRDSVEEAYTAYFINNKVSLVTVVGRRGKKSSGYATYHIENSSILRRDENGREIDNLKLIINYLNRDAAKLYSKRKNKL